MKKIKNLTWPVVIFLFLTLTISFPSFSQENPQDTNPHMTGLKEMTPEQLDTMLKTSPRITKVYVNQLGIKRINNFKLKNGAVPFNVAVKPLGLDIETTIGTETPTNIAPATSSTIPGILKSGAFQQTIDGTLSNTLPRYVDNSALKYFPPIRHQSPLGSCAQFSSTYYTMTYMYAFARDLDAKNGGDDYRFSPKWTYNMLNNGEDKGSMIHEGLAIGVTNGIATWSEFPYNANYLEWCLNPEVWKNAISRRFLQSGYVINVDKTAGLTTLKELLNNGYIVNFATYVFSWQFTASKNDPATTADDAFAKKPVVLYVNGRDGPHAMTIVGYNDDMWTDINGNGNVDPGEKGALKIANSWGDSWMDHGFCWFSYDALKATSSVSGGPHKNRVQGFNYYSSIYWITPRPSYTPSILAKFTLKLQSRGRLNMGLAISATPAGEPVNYFVSNALSDDGGAYSFKGTSAASDGTFYLDFSDLVSNEKSEKRYFLKMQAASTVTLKAFSLIDVEKNTTKEAPNLPVSASGKTIYPYIDYQYKNVNTPPVAMISASPSSGIAPLTVSFSSTGSSDPDGNITAYNWDFGDGTSATGTSASHTYTTDGTFTTTLTVTDNNSATDSATTTINVTNNNLPPVAVASGTPASGTIPLTVSFSGTDSNDPDGTITSYNWNFDDGTSATGETARHTYSSGGTFAATLTVTDNQGATATAPVTINANRPPTAIAIATPTSGIAPLSVSFSGQSSIDPDGTVASYQWNFRDGTTGTGVSPTHIYTTAGSYAAEMIVTDDDGASSLATVTVTVEPRNLTPIAIALGTPTSGLAPLTVSFSAAQSNDPDGTISSYTWNFGNGSSGTGATTSHTYSTKGSYTSTLTVTDNKGATSSVTVPIIVMDNLAPIAIASASPSSGEAPLIVNFSATGSSDPDGNITAYTWNFGDSTTGTKANTSHTYTQPGTYTARLTVIDNKNATASAAITITVSNASNKPPVAVISGTPASGTAPLAVSFSGANSSDPDGTITSYNWNFGDGTTATGITASHTYPNVGTYTARLLVTDNKGATASATTSITTSEPANQPPIAVISRTPASGTVPLTVSFSGANSSDPNGTITSYNWNFGDGTTASGMDISHIYENIGTYKVRLAVTDNRGTTGAATTTIIAATPNQPPVAIASATPTAGQAPMSVSFSSTGSADPDGNITSYNWDFGNGDSSTRPNPRYVYTTSGTFTATLTVTDNNGETAAKYIMIKTTAADNLPPIAVIANTSASGTAPLTISFSGGNSSDPDGTITSYSWNFGDGSTATAVTASHTYSNVGTYTARLTVTDNNNATASTTTTITINEPANQSPIAVISRTPASGTIPLAVSFSGANSSDPDGTITSYNWNFGDGTTATGVTASHTYPNVGTYTAKLTITDNKGATASATTTITANKAANQSPIAVISGAPTSGAVPLTVSFSGINSSDPDGAITAYSWDFGDGTTATGITTNHTFTEEGTFTTRLIVTDNQGATGSAATTITASTDSNLSPVAMVTATPRSGVTPLSVSFSSAGSNDPDGSISAYDWDFGNGATSSRTNPRYIYTSKGTFTAKLTITDNKGAATSTTVLITAN